MNKKTLGEMLDDFGFSVKEIAQEEPRTKTRKNVVFTPPAVIETAEEAFIRVQLGALGRREREALAAICAKICRGKWEAHLASFQKQHAEDDPSVPPSGFVCSARLGQGPTLL